jgi:hypothetical protein
VFGAYFARIAKSQHESGVKIKDFSDPEIEDKLRQGPGIGKRMRWGLRDKKQFQSRITNLDRCLGELQQHLADAQRQRLQEGMDRLITVAASSIVDQQSLTVVRSAVAGESAVSAIVERRAILDGQPWSTEITPRPGNISALGGFDLDQSLLKERRRILVRS